MLKDCSQIQGQPVQHLETPISAFGPGMKLSGRRLAQHEKSSVPSILYPQVKITEPRFTGCRSLAAMKNSSLSPVVADVLVTEF